MPSKARRRKSSGGDGDAEDEYASGGGSPGGEFEKPKRRAGNACYGGHGEEWRSKPFAKRMGNNKKLRSERELLALQAKMAKAANRTRISGKSKKAALKAKRAQKEEKRRQKEAAMKAEQEKRYQELSVSSPTVTPPPRASEGGDE